MTETKDKSSREKLVAATIELMSSHGFESTGINAILEEADVTKSNFYYHFKSKEDLCLEALDTMCESAFAQGIEPIFLDKKLSPKNRLRKMFDTIEMHLTDTQCAIGCPFVNLAAETSDFYPEFQKRLAAHFGQYAKLIASCYQEGVKKGEFTNAIGSAQAAQMILCLINGTILMAKVQKDVAAVKANSKALLALLSA
jgi:TetR/AcrR family transcriptional repressor of nem operon